MLLTRPKRKRLYGVAFAMLWLLVLICFWGITDAEKLDAPAGLTYFSTTTCNLGPIQWLGITARHFAVPAGIFFRRTYDFHVLGILSGILWSALSGWFLLWWWGKEVKHARLPSDRCDVCAYDLSGDTSEYCPECGEMSEELIKLSFVSRQNRHGFLFGLACLGALATIALRGPIQLLFITNLDLMYILAIGIGAVALLVLGIIILPAWIYIGIVKDVSRIPYSKERKHTPKNMQLGSILGVWLSMTVVMAGLGYSVWLRYHNPVLMGDYREQLRYFPIVLVCGIVLHVIVTRHFRHSARQAQVCFQCAARLDDRDHDLCPACSKSE